MRIVQINVTANSGSTGRIAEGIGRAAQKAGFESWIAYGRYANESTSHLIRIGEKKDYIEHGIESRILDNHGLASRSATTSFLKKIDVIKPDLIHLHNIHGYYINYKLLFQYIQQKKTPVVWTFHDCWPFTGHCTHFTFCGCDRWKTGCHNCPQKQTYPICYFFDRSRKNYEEKKACFNSIQNLTIVSVSNWLDDLVSQSFLKDHKRLVIHNGIDTDVFAPSSNAKEIRMKHGIQEDQTMLLGVASVWSERKGLQDFIELSKRLSPKEKIVLIGLTGKQIGSLPQNIIGLERTESTQQLAELYSAADIVLNLSKEESFGLTTVEGLSCGTPGIGYESTATPELFTLETGFIVPQGDIESVLHGIGIIQKKGKNAYFSACRKYALTHFRAKDRFQDYINLYHSI